MKKTVMTKAAPAAIGPYSQGNIFENLIFTSGRVPLDPETGEVVGSTIEEQTEQVLKNVKAILEEAGSSMHKVLKTTVFLKKFSRLSSIIKPFSCKGSILFWAAEIKISTGAPCWIWCCKVPEEAKLKVSLTLGLTFS